MVDAQPDILLTLKCSLLSVPCDLTYYKTIQNNIKPLRVVYTYVYAHRGEGTQRSVVFALGK